MARKKYKVLRPAYKNFLDDLRESGQANMFESIPWLMAAFEHLSKRRATEIFVEWAETFGKDNEYEF